MQVDTFPRVDRSQDTIKLIMPGRAGAAFPASFARAHPRLSRCFFTHSFSPPLSDGGVPPAEPPPPCSQGQHEGTDSQADRGEDRCNSYPLLAEESADSLRQHLVLIEDASYHLPNPIDLGQEFLYARMQKPP